VEGVDFRNRPSFPDVLKTPEQPRQTLRLKRVLLGLLSHHWKHSCRTDPQSKVYPSSVATEHGLEYLGLEEGKLQIVMDEIASFPSGGWRLSVVQILDNRNSFGFLGVSKGCVCGLRNTVWSSEYGGSER
jgi:hypothetical protein